MRYDILTAVKIDVTVISAKPCNLSEIYIYFETNCLFTLKMESANCPETGILLWCEITSSIISKLNILVTKT